MFGHFSTLWKAGLIMKGNCAKGSKSLKTFWPSFTSTEEAKSFLQHLLGQCFTHIETSQLVCSANWWTGLQMSVTLAGYSLLYLVSKLCRNGLLLPVKPESYSEDGAFQYNKTELFAKIVKPPS